MAKALGAVSVGGSEVPAAGDVAQALGSAAASAVGELRESLPRALEAAQPPPAPVVFALAAVSLGLSTRARGNQAWRRVRWLAGTAGALCFVASLTSTGLFLDYLP